MRLAKALGWALVAALAAVLARRALGGELKSPSLERLRGAAASSPSTAGTPEAAAAAASKPFDEPIDESVFAPPESREPTAPAAGLRRADFVIGKPRTLSEPKSPLNNKGEPKSSGRGWVSPVIGALVLGGIGALVGFLLGGPVGAAIGGGVGLLGGWFFAP